jgi:hypothetical protein
MNRIAALILAICCASFAPTLVKAGDFDGSQPLLCTVTDVTECLAGEKCKEVGAEAINLPRFLLIDVGKKTIHSKIKGDEARKSQIDLVKKVNGKLMLQGAEQGGDDITDGFGWTIAIMEDTGQMVLTASGYLVGDVAFGVCTSQ